MTKRTRRRRAVAADRVTRNVSGALTQARTASEIATASARTIAARTALLGGDLTRPAAWLHPESSRMIYEKFLVAGDINAALANRLANAYTMWANLWPYQMKQSMRTFLRLVESFLATPWGRMSARSTNTAIGNYLELSARLVETSNAIARAWTLPVHKAVTANARRLSERH